MLILHMSGQPTLPCKSRLATHNLALDSVNSVAMLMPKQFLLSYKHPETTLGIAKVGALNVSTFMQTQITNRIERLATTLKVTNIRALPSMYTFMLLQVARNRERLITTLKIARVWPDASVKALVTRQLQLGFERLAATFEIAHVRAFPCVCPVMLV